MEERLIFLISTPRSGSTLLMRILNATKSVYSRAEPHIMPPLAHLGFWDSVEKAPYDQIQAQQSIRDFVDELPAKHEDYFDACRAYTDVLYGRMMSNAADADYFLDKTPANALVLPFLEQLYPKAKYIVLTRHPAAIFSSYAQSFFDGDYQAAVKFNPILSRYIPVMAAFLRTHKEGVLHVEYEKLVSKPEATLERISNFLRIKFEPDAVNYQKEKVGAGLGDPIGVDANTRPVEDSVSKWAVELAKNSQKFEVVAKQLAGIHPDDLKVWGTDPKHLWDAIKAIDPALHSARHLEWSRFAMTRKALVMLRKDIHNKPIGDLVKRVRAYCDILLRG